MTDDRDDALAALTEQVTRLTEQIGLLVGHLQMSGVAGETGAPGARTYSIAEAADRLGVTESQLRTDVRQRRVPYLRVGKSYRFTNEQLQEITQIWTVAVIPDAPNRWGRKRRPQDEEARRWAHHRGEPMPVPQARRAATRPTQTPRQLSPTDTPIEKSPQVLRFIAEHGDRPHMRIVCPGVGVSVVSPPGDAFYCPSCGERSGARADPRKSGHYMAFRHIRYVLADSEEARTGRPWPGSTSPGKKAAARQQSSLPLVNLPTRVPTVTVRCPGSGKSVQLDKPTPPRCPSCKRDDLEVPRFTPSKSFGLVPAHGKTVPADSREAALPVWE
ncbi:excisionase family DNA-binding protein [Kineococcus endophyticus]|uniref:Excisionase family DNA-binding protein n=1 Tax=Kineococcus endophyticus TaxID=1181883 RepID=A0ABV3P159_9ACTN